MSIRHAGGFSLLLSVATACARASTSNSPNAIAPETGPKASIYASYTGGLFDRSTYASFSVERPSYVMVAHLSGEGVIRVVYPEDPRETEEKIIAGKSIRTRTFLAPYDGVPSLYTNTVSPLRNLGARINSYDGRGHAYIFLIASDKPLRVDDFSGGGLWDEIDVPNYNWVLDPRRFVKDFADQVTDGAPYTLKYADSYRTTNFTSYADQQWACSALAMLPYAALASLSYHYHSFGHSYCPRSLYYSLLDQYYYRVRQPRQYAAPTAGTFVPVPVPPKKPDTVIVLTRSERHPASPTNPGPRRKVLAGEAAEEFAFPSRPRPIDSEKEFARPRRADEGWSYTPPTHSNRVRGTSERPRAREAERSERPQPGGTERAQVERTERPQPVRAERPQSPPPQAQPQSQPRAEPQATPPPPPRPKPPGDR